MQPLAGLRVLDLSRLLPGPYCTLLLADLGADVIKVEGPEGDWLRTVPPMRGTTSALFQALNRNKRSIVIDLKSVSGAGVLRTLAARCDILIEGFRAGVMDRLGLGATELHRVNRRLIFCSLTGWGEADPRAERGGHDLGYLARSGVLAYGGEPDLPSMPGGQIADVGGALFAAVAVLTAVHERDRTGEGRHVQVSLAESSLAFVHMQLGARLLLGGEGAPLARGRETLNGGSPRYRIYRTKDGRHLAVAALEPKFWTAFCDAAGRPDLVGAGRLTGDEGDRVRRELEAVVGARTLAQWEELLADADVCCEPVREGDEVLGDETGLVQSLLVEENEPREGGPVRHLRTPLRMGVVTPRGAPGLGEHTDEVLEQAGLTPGEIAELRRSGAIG